MQVVFQSDHQVAHVAGASCNKNSDNSRCDNAQGVSGGAPAPTIEPTFVLNDLLVQEQVSGGWHLLRKYQFRYAQAAGGTLTDPMSGQNTGYAGYLNLTQVQAYGIDGSTNLPSHVFGYQYIEEYHKKRDVYHEGTRSSLSSSCPFASFVNFVIDVPMIGGSSDGIEDPGVDRPVGSVVECWRAGAALGAADGQRHRGLSAAGPDAPELAA